MPGLLGLAGAAGTGLALAPWLQLATYPMVAIGGGFLARGWWLQLRHRSGGIWPRRSLAILAASTALAVALWVLRFVGLLVPPWPTP